MTTDRVLRAITDLQPGDHLGFLYQTEAEHRALLTPFLRQGLERGEKVVYIMDVHPAETILDYLRDDGLEVEPYLARGQLRLMTPVETFLRTGIFNPDDMIAFWRTETERALAEGYQALRAAGELTWALQDLPDPERLFEFESKLSAFLPGTKFLAVCLFEGPRLDPEALFNMLATHPTAAISPEIYGHFYYLPAADQVPGGLPMAVLRYWLETQAERKRAEEALLASEARLQAAIDAADIGLWDWDLVSGQIIWLGHHDKLFGFAPGEFDGTYPSFEKRIHPEDLEELNRVVQRARDEESEYAHEYRVIWPDGSIHWIAGRGRFVYNETGQPVRMYGAVLDITERKEAEALLYAREQEFRAFVENAPDQIIRYDKEFRRAYANPAVIAAYGLPKEALIGKPIGSIVEDAGLKTDINEINAVKRPIQSVFDTGESTEYELTWPLPGGRRTFWVRLFPEFDPNGEVINVLGIARDITERKQAEAAIRSLLQISEKLHATLDIDALLDSLVIEAMKLIDAEIGWSGLRTEEGMVCHTHIARDLQVAPFKYFWPPGVGLPGWVLVHKVPYVMNDAQSDKVIIPEIRERFGVNAAIDTPILDAQGEVIGFFEVNNKKNGAGFSESDVEKLVAVSRIASIALQNAMSYGNLERAEKTLQRQAARREVLAEISQALAEVGLDVQAVLDTIVRRTTEVIGDACVLTLLSSDERWFKPVAFHHSKPEVKALMESLFTATSGSVSNEWLAPVLQTGQPLFTPIVPQEQMRQFIQPEYLPFVEQVGIHSVLIVPLRVQGQVIGTLGVTRDAPGRPYTPNDQAFLLDLADRAALTLQNAQLFEDVRTGGERLQVLSRRLLEVQEAERRHIARELHDEIGQILTGLKFLMEINTPLPAASIQARLDKSLRLADELTTRLQELSLNLRPPMLDELGLLPTLAWHFKRYTDQTNIQVDFKYIGPERRFGPEIETAVYRIVQEALTNVARHAQVSEVTVQVWVDPNSLRIQIEDAGVGFDLEVALAAGTSSGLTGIYERTALLAGQLTIVSAPGAGASLIAEFPLGDPVSERSEQP